LGKKRGRKNLDVFQDLRKGVWGKIGRVGKFEVSFTVRDLQSNSPFRVIEQGSDEGPVSAATSQSQTHSTSNAQAEKAQKGRHSTAMMNGVLQVGRVVSQLNLANSKTSKIAKKCNTIPRINGRKRFS